MRKMLLTAVLAGTTMIAPGLVPQARADHGWFGVGAGFRVGAAHISLLFGQPVRVGYRPAYYYRYDRPIAYQGVHCSRYCYREGGYYYHHQSCPLVRAHFRAYNVDPYWAYSHYAPRGAYGYQGYDGYYDGYYDGGYNGGYYDGGYYDGGYYGGAPYYGGTTVYIDGYYSGGRHYRDNRYYGDHRYYRNDRNYRDNRYYRDGRRDNHYYRNDHHRDGDHRRGDYNRRHRDDGRRYRH